MDLQGIFGAAFGALYLDGTIVREDREEMADGGFTRYERRKGVKYQPDTVTENMRVNGGYTEKDGRFLILQIDQHGHPLERPTTDAELITQAGRWALQSVDGDPGATHWIVRASPA